MSLPIVRRCENFVLGIQGDENWADVPPVQKEAADLCGECIEWFTAEHTNDLQFSSTVLVFFSMLSELYTRDALPKQEVRELRDRALEKIDAFSSDIKNGDIKDFLRCNTSLGSSESEKSDNELDDSDDDY